jgi:hypothetical protein
LPSLKVVLFTTHDPASLATVGADAVVSKQEAALKLPQTIRNLLRESSGRRSALPVGAKVER